jgi:hypothetical protein
MPHLLLLLCQLYSLLCSLHACLAVGLALLQLLSSLFDLITPPSNFPWHTAIPIVHALASICNRLQWWRRPDGLIGLSRTTPRPLLVVDHSALILVQLLGAADASKNVKVREWRVQRKRQAPVYLLEVYGSGTRKNFMLCSGLAAMRFTCLTNVTTPDGGLPAQQL